MIRNKSQVSTPDSAEAISMTDDVPKLSGCKLTPDQRFVVFCQHDDPSLTFEDMEPLEMAKVLDFKPIQDDKGQIGKSLSLSFPPFSTDFCVVQGSVFLRVKLNGEGESSLKLDSPPEPSRKPSLEWLSALIKVKKKICSIFQVIKSKTFKLFIYNYRD